MLHCLCLLQLEWRQGVVPACAVHHDEGAARATQQPPGVAALPDR